MDHVDLLYAVFAFRVSLIKVWKPPVPMMMKDVYLLYGELLLLYVW